MNVCVCWFATDVYLLYHYFSTVKDLFYIIFSTIFEKQKKKWWEGLKGQF